MHLDEEQVQRLVDRELPAAEAHSLRRHLSECADCRAKVADVEREDADIHRLLRLLDHPAPPVTAESVVRAASRRYEHRPWAAGVLLALGLAGAAYAAPGSPLRTWIDALGTPGEGRPAPPAPTREAEAHQPAIAGVAVAPGRRLLLSFDSAQAAGEAVVTLSQAARQVTIRAPAAAATFTSDPERLVIHNAGAATSYAVEVPQDAPRVEIRVAGFRIFLKDGDRITVAVPSQPSTGAYHLPLSP